MASSSPSLTPKKIVSFVVFIAAAFLVALVIQNLGDRTYERNEYQKPALAPDTDADGEDGPPTLTSADLEAQLYGAQADANWQSSLLATLRGPQPSQAQMAAVRAAVVKAQAALTQTESDAYDSSKDAVHKTDSFLDVNDEINAKHQEMLDILSNWKADVTSGTPPTSQDVSNYLSSIQKDLNDMETLVGDLVPQDPGLTQAQIDSYKAAVDSAITEINQTITDLTTAQTNVQTAENTLATDESVGDQGAIQDQEDKVVQAEAKVAALEDDLSQVNAAQGADTSQSSSNSNFPTVIQNDNSTNQGTNLNLQINEAFDPTKPHLVQGN